MSGLAAVITFDGRDVSADAQRMVHPVPHRCRTGVQRRETDNASLIHLCSHEPSPTDGDPQLAYSPGGSVVVVADARIDNLDEVVAGLAPGDPGYFEQPTDAQAILAAYLRWGVDAAEHLIGDFAFVIWDAARGRVVAARDPMAMRPLYFRLEPHRRLLVASEAKQILAASSVPRRINERAVAHHLVNRFDPLEWSFYEGVEILAPGHSIAVNKAGSHIWQHWEFDPNHEITYATEDEYIEHFRELIIGSVKARVGLQRPMGFLLSGGMDSGTAAGVAAWLRATNAASVPEIRAYTWNYGDLIESDERHISRLLIDHFGIAETEISVAHLGPLAEYPQHGPDLDTPFLGSFQPAIERSLEVAADEGCGLVMSGDRGDLINGALIVNYPHLARTRRWRQLGQELRRHRSATGEPMRSILLGDLIAPALRRLRQRPVRGSQPQRPLRPPWLQQEFAARTDVAAGRGGVGFGGTAIAAYYREERRRLILEPMHMRGVMWTERTHASAGLGFADLWSDRRLAEFVVAIPQQVINRPGRNDKQPVRKAMVGVVPDSFLAAADKILPTPLYRRGLFDEGAATVHGLFQDSRAAGLGFIDDAEVIAAYERVRSGGADSFPIWRTICVEMWLRAHWDTM